ncbi:MAG: MlaD family protein [Tepidisphaeraceae bacterium]|jgi:ABC-type transporter Mla subunit MlaD
MANSRNAVRAGFFMLVSLAGAIAIVIGIAGYTQFTTPYATHLVGFTLQDNVGGLRKGDDVRLGGLKVGIVNDIRYVKAGTLGDNRPTADGIIAWISIPADYVLTTDATVSIETSLTGVTAVNISNLGRGQELASDAVLVGKPDALTAFKDSLADFGPKLNADLDKVHSTLDTYDKAGAKASVDIHELVADLHARLKQVSDSAQAALDSIHELLGPSTTDFHESVANVRDLTKTLKDKAPPLTASMQTLLDKLNDTVARAQGAVDDVRATAANAKDITETARSVILRNQSRIDEIVAGIKKASDNIDQATVEIRSSPWRLLYKPTADEMANLNLYDAAREFADGANNLSDAAAALRDEMKDPQADPAKIQKMYDNLTDQFTKFQQAEDDLWTKVRP